MTLLTHKVIFLTGGASGIGEACADAYVKAGARVLVMDKDETSLNQLMSRLGNEHAGFVGDVQQEADVKSAIETALARFGKIDVIHNNAGIASPSKPLDQTTENEWDSLFSINLKSVY